MLKLLALCILLASGSARAQTVVAIEPSAAVLPANTLRFYVVFDRPARAAIHQQDIRLLDSKNRPLLDAFMDFGQELWSPDGQRLTVLFDPGKVKRGVEAPDAELSPLEAGRTYQLVLGTFRHAFRVEQPVRTKIDPNAWASARITSKAVEVVFDRVMDSALVEDQLHIEDRSRIPIPCVVRAIEGGRAVRFELTKPLAKGSYVMTVGELIEDVAGNRMNEALDHAVGETIPESHRAEVWFRVP